MPIEDIDFLGTNSEVDSTLFFLDSNSRDRQAYPTPAEYVIQFSEPIKLVTGVDILDATIPAAMYIIDAHSETLGIAILKAPSDQGAGVEAHALMAEAFDASITFQTPMSDPSFLTVYCMLVDESYHAAVALAAALAADAAVPGIDKGAFMIVVRQAAEGMPGHVRGAWPTYVFPSAKPMEHLSTQIPLLLTVRKASLVLQHGNYDVVTLMLMLSDSLKAVEESAQTAADSAFGGFDVVSPSAGVVSLQGRYAFVNTCPFFMDMRFSVSSVATVLGFGSAASSQAAKNGSGYRDMIGNDGYFGSVTTTSVSAAVLSNPSFKSTPAHIVVAPGIANLLGVRYITLRCPEIEQHMYSGMTYGSHSTGLGVFKLPSGSEVANLRFDFVSLVRRPFHPIGRLSRLTLRFERDDGILYDFKGINTQLLLAVKFLSPGKRVPLKQSVLNPDYDPDFLRYTVRMSSTEAVETTENNRLGLMPLIPARPLPFEPHDNGVEDRDRDAHEAEGDADESDGNVFQRRQEIARRLLKEQDKYDYPASTYDDAAWRGV